MARKTRQMTDEKNDAYLRHVGMQKEQILRLMRQSGCRITQQRQTLLDVILQEECGSCKEIYYKAKKADHRIGCVVFGTAGIKILSGKDAKKAYTNCTAALLRAKECIMKTVTSIQENAEDIYAEAQQINEERAAAEGVFDSADNSTEEAADDFREADKEETEETT